MRVAVGGARACCSALARGCCAAAGVGARWACPACPCQPGGRRPARGVRGGGAVTAFEVDERMAEIRRVQ